MHSSETNRIILTKAQIKGFKSIEDLTIEFCKGLNIVIGKNGSGKSNFLESLFFSLNSSRRNGSPRFSKLELVTAEKEIFSWEAEKGLVEDLFNDVHANRTVLNEKVFLNGERFFDNKEGTPSRMKYKNVKIFGTSALSVFYRLGHQVLPLYLKFETPKNLICLDFPGTLTLNNPKDLRGLHGDSEEADSLNFIFRLFLQVEDNFEEEREKIKSITKKKFLKELEIRVDIKDNLRIYTPIKNIRFNENVNLYKIDDSVTIENLKMDFYVNNNWIPWSQLSDGTKRLFYIVAEITSHEGVFILIEEPELGIHPQQFNLVMDFLKEESEDKQIIMSTHSPQALNHLKEEELSNILVTYYDSKKGTQIKHLTTQQKNKAKKYMKEVGFLSDYWMLSDLE